MAAPGSILIVGYGNELRGDDGAGPQAARMVSDWDLPGVEVLIRHQLVPELAEFLAKAKAAIFLDAVTARAGDRAEVIELTPSAGSHLAAHLGDPRVLLALAKALYGRSPPSWLVRIPAVCFDLGAPFSGTTEEGIKGGLALTRRLLAHL